MVETLQRMVAEATAKVQAREAAKVADLERPRAMAEHLVDRQAREHELALRKAKSKQAALEQERKAAQDEVHRLGSRLHQTRTTLQEEWEAREHALTQVEKPRSEVPRTSSPTRAQPRKEANPKEGEWQAVTRHGQKGKGPPQGEPTVRDAEMTAGQTATKQPKRVKSQVHRRTPSDESQISGESLTESARRVCARTPERSFDPVSLSDEGTSKI